MPDHPKNAPGDFYVAPGCCTLCGVPQRLAPELFAGDDKACWVARQPASPSDFKKMLKVMDAQDRSCVRYRGSDPAVRLAVPSECVDPRQEQPPTTSS